MKYLLKYRPITLLSTIDEIAEKFIADQIKSFYKKHDDDIQKQV